MHLINFPCGARLITEKCYILECKKWCCFCCCCCWRRFLISTGILLKCGNCCAYYLTYNLLGSMSDDGRNDITFTLPFLLLLVKICVQKQSHDQDKHKTMAVEIIGFSYLVKGSYILQKDVCLWSKQLRRKNKYLRMYFKLYRKKYITYSISFKLKSFQLLCEMDCELHPLSHCKREVCVRIECSMYCGRV